MAEYRLHCFCQSGNAFKVAAMLAVTGADWEPVLVDYFHDETRSPGFRERTNEMGEVPVLEHAGKRLSQSGAILTYLADTLGQLGGRDADERLEILRWILFDNHKFTSYLATYRFLRAFAATPGDPAVLAFLRARVDASLAIVERHLATTPFIVGDRLTIADLSMSAYPQYPADELGYDLAASHPHITRWLAAIRATPGWTPPYELMPGTRLPPRPPAA
jgi:glutathione S-transferase